MRKSIFATALLSGCMFPGQPYPVGTCFTLQPGTQVVFKSTDYFNPPPKFEIEAIVDAKLLVPAPCAKAKEGGRW